ncbi:MAG: pyrroline-5-carboxylate reductase [Candidatus Latescibacterota bacterium]|jgi:pyrroline-5-carboxylate reductase
MLTNHTIAVIGAGNIGCALIGGLTRKGELDAGRVWATRRNPAALDLVAERFPGIRTGTDNVAAVREASIVILAIKPQNAAEVLSEIETSVGSETLVISTLAGTTTSSISAQLGQDVPVIRTMPNTPALVDEGATALSAGTHASDEHLELAQRIFSAVGMVEVVPEYLMDAVTGLSGSGPAYVYMVIEALTDGGVKQGLTRPTALRLAAQTVFGAAKLVIETGRHPAILRDEVTTPGGTAIAAVAELESHGLRTMLINAVATATRRSEELRKS